MKTKRPKHTRAEMCGGLGPDFDAFLFNGFLILNDGLISEIEKGLFNT